MEAAAVFHKVLIKNYADRVDISLADFIDALENLRTNVKLSRMLRDACEGNPQIDLLPDQSSTGAGSPIQRKRAVAILESRAVASQFKLIDTEEVAPLLSPWFITAYEKQKIHAGLLQTGDKMLAADMLFDTIVNHFEQGKADVSLQDLIDTLKETGKYQNLIASLEKACK